MRSLTCAILDPRKISAIREELDAFIGKNSDNPFLLSVFIKQTMESALRKGTIPILLFFRTEGRIIGAVPLVIGKRFGIRFAAFLFDFWFSPDFIFDLERNEICMQNTLSYLFNHLKCQFATFDLPAGSLNVPVLERICATNGITYRKKNDAYLNHRIIPVERTWADFKKSRGKKFRCEFRSIERKLGNAGSWQITLFENTDHEEIALRKIKDVESASWKQIWRLQQNLLLDEQLFQLWTGSSFAIKTNPDFKRKVWLLELNGTTIAYSFAIQYKGTAYLAKTSYNKQYRGIYPGVYIFNWAIRDLFNCGEVKNIDFLTNLPFLKKWASQYKSRSRFVLHKGFLPKLLAILFQQPQIQSLRRFIPKLLQ